MYFYFFFFAATSFLNPHLRTFDIISYTCILSMAECNTIQLQLQLQLNNGFLSLPNTLMKVGKCVDSISLKHHLKFEVYSSDRSRAVSDSTSKHALNNHFSPPDPTLGAWLQRQTFFLDSPIPIF